MAASPRVQGFSVKLLKQAQQGRPGGMHSLWSRTRSAVAEGTASLLGASFRKAYTQLLDADPEGLVCGLRGHLRRNGPRLSDGHRCGQRISAGCERRLAASDRRVRRRTATLLGRHDKMILGPEDQALAQPGDAWHVIDTPVGKVGILLGEEALYPEAGRVLAYQGAELLVTLAAVGDETIAAHIRHATIARGAGQPLLRSRQLPRRPQLLAADEGSAPVVHRQVGHLRAA